MSINTLKFSSAIRVGTLSADPASPENGMIYYNSSSGKLRQYVNGGWNDVTAGTISLVGQALLENNIVVGDGSDLSASLDTSAVGDILIDSTTGATYKALSITNAHISASAAIALSKLAALTATRVVVTDGSGVITVASYAPGDLILRDGSVPFTADQSMGSNKLTSLANGSNAGDAVNKGQLDTKQSTSEKGQANGYASLDGSGKVPVSQLPNAIMEYQGMWDASTNTPALANGAGNADEAIGNVYRASAAGTVDFGAGNITFEVGDYAILNSSKIWEKADTTDAVSSVNGMTGAVTLDSDDIAEGSSNLYFTNERAQDAVGSILVDSDTIDFTYDDAGNTITAIVKDNSITNAKITTGVDAAKIADGSVSNAEFQYLANVTSDIQTQLNSKLDSVSEDTAPQLGGDLDLNSKSIMGKRHYSALADAANFVEKEYLHATTLTASTTAVASAFTFAFASFEGCVIDYKIKEATTNAVRIGRLRVATNGTNISLVDDMTETSDVGVTWSAAINGANVELSYTTTANAKTMRAEVLRVKS
jgi:hypothetical protein